MELTNGAWAYQTTTGVTNDMPNLGTGYYAWECLNLSCSGTGTLRRLIEVRA